MSSVASEERHLKAGDKLIMTLAEGDEQTPVYQAEYLVEQTPAIGDVETALRVKLLGENWRSPHDQVFHEPPGEPIRGGVKDGLEVAKFAWDIIKDNKPKARGPGTMTSVLVAGSNSLDYTGAVEGQSQKMTLSVKDAWWPHPEYIHVDFRLEGTYRATGAKPDLPHGHYLPSVYFNVTKCWATWPTWIEASAEVAGPYDKGSARDRQPEIKVYGKFSFGWIGSANNHTCGFVANAVRGFASRGWER